MTDSVRESAEYRAIAGFYGDRRARRSQVPLMQHIEEGLVVLGEWLKASCLVQRAYCLHPLLQGDEELRQSLREGRLGGLDPSAVALAMEYRRVANGFLSAMEAHPGYCDPGGIDLGPLAEVRQMLIADKVQNCKDFRLYHAEHPRRDWLERYFQSWLTALGADPAWVEALTRRSGGDSGRE